MCRACVYKCSQKLLPLEELQHVLIVAVYVWRFWHRIVAPGGVATCFGCCCVQIPFPTMKTSLLTTMSVAAAKILFWSASSLVVEKSWCGVAVAVWKIDGFCMKKASQSWHCSLPTEVPIRMVRESSCCCYLSVIFICNVSMLCAYAVSSLYRDRETKRQLSTRQDKSCSVTPRLSSCSCNQYLFIVAAVPMVF